MDMVTEAFSPNCLGAGAHFGQGLGVGIHFCSGGQKNIFWPTINYQPSIFKALLRENIQ
jgi:hypothetical protein